MTKRTQSNRRAWNNRPEHHEKKKVNNKYLGEWLPLDQQFTIRRDGRVGRVFDLNRPYEPLSDPVQWNQLDDGRLYITHEGKKLYAHHLVWLLVHGDMPKRVKFKDNDRSNIDPDNLIAIETHKPSYQARVRVGDTIKCLGSFPTHEEAVAAQNAFKALMKLGIV